MLKEREATIEVMKKVVQARYPTDKKNTPSRIKRQIKKGVPASIGLRNCLKAINEQDQKSTRSDRLILPIIDFQTKAM